MLLSNLTTLFGGEEEVDCDIRGLENFKIVNVILQKNEYLGHLKNEKFLIELSYFKCLKFVSPKPPSFFSGVEDEIASVVQIS